MRGTTTQQQQDRTSLIVAHRRHVLAGSPAARGPHRSLGPRPHLELGLANSLPQHPAGDAVLLVFGHVLPAARCGGVQQVGGNGGFVTT